MNCVNAETLKRNHLESEEQKLKYELWRVQAELYNMEHGLPPLPKQERGMFGKLVLFIDRVFTIAFIACASFLGLVFLWCLVSAFIDGLLS